MLAVCEGGNDAAAVLVVALVIGAWALVAALVVRAARDQRERLVLIAVILASGLTGPAILFGLLNGLDGDNDQLPEIIATLLLPGLIAAGVAVGMRAAHAARAFFLAFWGAIFLVGAYLVLVISLLAIGTACLS